MDKYDKMTNETLNKAYADFLEGLKKEDTISDLTSVINPNDYDISSDSISNYGKLEISRYNDHIDSKTIFNGYEIKPELMNKISSFEEFNMFLENCKNNVIEDTNRQKTASILSRTIATNYDEKEIKLLIEYLQEIIKKESN